MTVESVVRTGVVVTNDAGTRLSVVISMRNEHQLYNYIGYDSARPFPACEAIEGDKWRCAVGGLALNQKVRAVAETCIPFVTTEMAYVLITCVEIRLLQVASNHWIN